MQHVCLTTSFVKRREKNIANQTESIFSFGSDQTLNIYACAAELGQNKIVSRGEWGVEGAVRTFPCAS